MRGRAGRYLNEQVTVRRVTVFVVALIEASIGFAMAVGVMQMTVVDDIRGHVLACAEGQDGLRAELAECEEARQWYVDERGELMADLRDCQADLNDWKVSMLECALELADCQDDRDGNPAWCVCCEWEKAHGLACERLTKACEAWHDERAGF